MAGNVDELRIPDELHKEYSYNCLTAEEFKLFQNTYILGDELPCACDECGVFIIGSKKRCACDNRRCYITYEKK